MLVRTLIAGGCGEVGAKTTLLVFPPGYLIYKCCCVRCEGMQWQAEWTLVAVSTSVPAACHCGHMHGDRVGSQKQPMYQPSAVSCGMIARQRAVIVWQRTSNAFRAELKWIVVPLGAPAADARCMTLVQASQASATAVVFILSHLRSNLALLSTSTRSGASHTTDRAGRPCSHSLYTLRQTSNSCKKHTLYAQKMSHKSL
jgi:hypothetical protein